MATTSRIAVLPSALADQIAAGEVVERAASVVKELCENAIDAGAHRIEVDIDGGGRRMVRVVDDGSGMTPDEARLSLRRHATSKIRSADDLWGLSTFGFRGEALPSIAAVSRLTLSTKLPGADAGFRLTVEAGIETDAREVGIPVGTQIEVSDLFFNTPARLKFQKTEATEAANVSEAVLRLALGHPDVHFRLRAGGRMVLDLPAHQKLGERVRAAFARRGAGALHEALGEEGGHAVHAFLAAPEEASTTARSTFMFVGRRFIRDRPLLHALSLGYGDLLEKGRYPLAALFLEVPGAELDVNVHPQKLEVRFARPAEVYAAVRHVVGAGVARAPWLAAARGTPHVHTLPLNDRVDDRGSSREGERELTGSGGPESSERRSSELARPRVGGPAAWDWRGPIAEGRLANAGAAFERTKTDEAVRAGRAADGPSPLFGADGSPAFGAAGLSFLADPMESSVFGDARSRIAFFESLVYVGQLQRTYLVCEGAGEMVLIDQHAAHERVAFQRIRTAHANREIRRQRLLFPLPIEVGAASLPVASDAIAALQTLGFEIDFPSTPAGASHVLLRAVPEPLKDADPKPLLQEILRQFSQEPEDDEAERVLAGAGAGTRTRLDHILATMACHSVVRAGDELGRPEALILLAQLVELARADEMDFRAHRPHGRPILLRLAVSDLERFFDRG